MADASRFDGKFEDACANALQKFGFDNFKEKQILAMKELMLGRDVFVNLPTGSGKSLIFQAFPLVFDYMRGNEDAQVIVVVISPLLSLMKDQVNYLISKGVKAAFLGEGQDDESVKNGIEKGLYQIVYGSPETFLATNRWRKTLSNTVYRQRLCLIAVDEAHCISHWGFSAKKGETAFRIWFRRINELRSLVGSVPLVALTATATKTTRSQIIKTLEMENVAVFSENPNRKNIAYGVQVTGDDPLTTFSSLIQEIKEKGRSCGRVIIYCPKIKVVSTLYGIFKAELGVDMYVDRGTCNLRERLVEMYHSRIDDENKDEILKSFSSETGCIRVLIATIAYGMGIDCKGVKDVIHYGPPQNLERYLQESGRAGRSAEANCRAVILYSNVMLQSCDESIMAYVRNNSICRRKLLLEHFDYDLYELERYNHAHQCCDICKSRCKCDVNTCSFVYFDNTLPQHSTEKPPERLITSGEKEKLVAKLEYLKRALNSSFLEMALKHNVPLLTPIDLLSGFGDCQMAQVVDHASKIFTLTNVYEYVDIWHHDVATEILYVLNLVFGDCDHDFDENDEQLLDSSFIVPDIDLWCGDDLDFVPSDFLTAEDMHTYPEEQESL
ncbi:putative ATP-dependent DNA helicase RecS [Oculina patagonica]